MFSEVKDKWKLQIQCFKNICFYIMYYSNQIVCSQWKISLFPKEDQL